ncbi:MAG: outer membrane lipoprotein carrier protein LolA [Proteobacteria bacterium]|nr:outer membrane lipoprotein carrier protein LolA [Pseudomonadota bacterium]
MIRTFLAAVLILAAGLGGAAPLSGAAERAVLSPDQSAAVRRAVRYLNAMTTLKARFIQISSNGAYAEGQMIIQRPGRLRFDYDPPHPVLIIANGLSLLFYDRDLKQASFLPLWETPLWFLIRKEVTLSEDVVVTGVEQAFGTLRITLEDREMADAGSVTLVFSDRPLDLKKWEIVDAQGIMTQVSLVNPRYGMEVDQEAFDYSDLEIETGLRSPDDK